MTAKHVMFWCFALPILAMGVAAMAEGGMPIRNFSSGYQEGLVGALADANGKGSIEATFWAIGQRSQHNSGQLSAMELSLSIGDGRHLVSSNWSASGVWGGPPSTAERTAFLYSIENGGRGQYLLMSVGYGGLHRGYDFDRIINGNGSAQPNVTRPVDIPKVSVHEFSRERGRMLVGLTWPQLDSLHGFFDSIPSTNLISGVAVRYCYAESSPPTMRTEEWSLAEGGFVEFVYGWDPGGAHVTVPIPPDGMKTFFALSVLCDGATPASGGCQMGETAYVGQPQGVDLASPVFGMIQANRRVGGEIRVEWSMLETGWAQNFVVLYSMAVFGDKYQLGPPVPARYLAKSNYVLTGSAPGAQCVWVLAIGPNGKVLSRPVQL